VKHNRFTQIALIVTMLVTLIGSTHQAGSTAKAQPQLIQLAQNEPNHTVSVIIQKQGKTDAPEEQVAKLGGKVTRDLSIINAFSAELTAETAIELSRAKAVRWVSLNADMASTICKECINTRNLASSYIGTIRADKVWKYSTRLQGQGIGIAIVDSGVDVNKDLITNRGVNRVVADVRFNSDDNQTTSDGFGHGTHIAGIVGGDGSESHGRYIGVAPMVNIINVKVCNDDGSTKAADIIQGLQWVLENKDEYNIHVVNLSLNSTVAESYHTSPLDAAVEILWFNNIVVVASAGNQANGILYPPANDPFIITVGATDDQGTTSLNDDFVTSFSAYGTTLDGVTKPDLVAPGKNIVAQLVNTDMVLAIEHPDNVVSRTYFRMSGTSVSAPMVSGAVAILLQSEPELNPDQVKYRLMFTANDTWNGYSSEKAGAGYLDVFAAIKKKTTESANTGIQPSQLLTTGSDPITWGSVGWNSVGWNSVGWNSVGWNSVGWNSVGWNSDYWGP